MTISVRACTTTALLFLTLVPSASAQTSPAPIRIEVASVRPHKQVGADDPSNRRVLPGGRFVATGTSVRTLIRTAFALDDDSILNAPGWISTQTYDIVATTVDHAEVNTPEQFQQLMLSLLQGQFGFRFHRSTREGPVFWLVLDHPGKLGPALKPTTPGTATNISMSGDRKVVMTATNVPMPDFARSLTRRAGRPVEDHTNLQGRYDIAVQWTSEPTPDSDDPSLFTAVREQLGLKLQPGKGTVDTLVVENVDRPADQ